MSIPTYDPGAIIIIFLGIKITGFADGTFVEIERDEDAYKKTVGAGGEVARTRSRNLSGKATFTLMGSSFCNDLLSAAAILDESLGSGVGPILIKDLNGTTLIHGANAWIQKVPKVPFGKELTDREWVIDIDAVEFLVGGNNLSPTV